MITAYRFALCMLSYACLISSIDELSSNVVISPVTSSPVDMDLSSLRIIFPLLVFGSLFTK